MFAGPSRRGRVQAAWLTFLGSAGVLAGLIALLAFDPTAWFSPRPEARPLLVYCAAGMKVPVEEVAREYEREYGVPVQTQYGGSQTLLANIEVSDSGDLYLPADESYVRLARAKGLIAEVLPLARMRAVLAVPKGNPKGLRALPDVWRRPVRLAFADPEAAAIGKLTAEALRRSGEWEALRKQVVVNKLTVNDVANDVLVGSADAGVVWDVTVKQYPGLEAVADPRLNKVTAHLSLCVLRRCTQPAAALHFARYLAARDRGLPRFQKYGFEAVEGDRWAERPELLLYAGAMLRPAIEETVSAFEAREGVKVTTVYNGCGILVGEMRTKERPDAYFACDASFMTRVRDLFDDPVTVSSNQLVILVPKGNPHKIRRLKDLARPGLKVGIGNEKLCALGALTQETLRQDRTARDVMKNVVAQSPTGDLLVNQLRTGALDAAVAYLSNAAGAGDVLEAIPIDIKCAFAEQPVAVGKTSDFKQLTGRLVDALRSRESRERFEAYGFGWKMTR
jgi:molybdate transport system substrate-binding protein